MDPFRQPPAIQCVSCRRGGLEAAEVMMSADGWMCEPCHKQWDKAEQDKQPRPWLEREKRRLSLEDLPEATLEDLRQSKRSRAIR
jgi:hypothetical protein